MREQAVPENSLARLGLGTVQFGMDYGISNDLGKCSLEEVGRILTEADRLGIRVLDTAPSYGDAEAAIGRSVPEESKFRVVAKTVPVSGVEVGSAQGERLIEDFEASCVRLKISSAYGLLVHHADDLLKPGGDKLMTAMQKLKSDGRVRKIGVSVYNAAQIDTLIERYDIDLMQLPVNVLDQRLIRSGHMEVLAGRGIEIHARSIFLQGLLLMPPESISTQFGAALPQIRAYHTELKKRGMSMLEGALGFARSVRELEVALVGVASVEQLRQNMRAYQSTNDIDYSAFAVDDAAIVDPQQWKSS
jgi:aryl-alcohol dehydrogenase-like predicted oxidoreductase